MEHNERKLNYVQLQVPSLLMMSELQTYWDIMGNRSFRVLYISMQNHSTQQSWNRRRSILAYFQLEKKLFKEVYNTINRFLFYVISALSWPTLAVIVFVQYIILTLNLWYRKCIYWRILWLQLLKIGKYVIRTFIN